MLKQSLYKVSTILLLLFIAACSDGGSSNNDNGQLDNTADPDDTTAQGAAVKGPLVGATVSAYVLDPNAQDYKGRLIDTGTTDENARIQDLVINARRIGPFLIEFEGGTELLTGNSPFVVRMRTLMTSTQLIDGVNVYATPLTTLMLDLGYLLADSGEEGRLSDTEFLAGVAAADQYIKQSIGLGLIDDLDLMTTAPMITGDDGQAETLAYRTANEALAALLLSVRESTGTSLWGGQLLKLLAEDMADGVIDGDNEAFSSLTQLEIKALLTQDVTALSIPQSNYTVGQVLEMLIEEAAIVAPSVSLDELNAAALPATRELLLGRDSDGDLVIDSEDQFPANPNESVDTDGDFAKWAEAKDLPVDLANASTGSGFGDNSDRFPGNFDEWADCDNDGLGDNQVDDDISSCLEFFSYVLTDWQTANIFTGGVPESAAGAAGVGIIEIAGDADTYEVSVVFDTEGIAGIDYTGTWTVNLRDKTITPTVSDCQEDATSTFSGCEGTTPAGGVKALDFMAAGEVYPVTVDNPLGSAMFTLTWVSNDQVSNVHNFIFTKQ